jgi:hypothetical protein
MTLSRLVPLHIHGALELVLAAAIMTAPFVLGFETPAMIVSVLLGALIFGVALATHSTDEGALPISTHAAMDACFAVVMAGGAVTFGLTDDAAAAVFLAASALLVTLLTSLTRYSPSRA